MTKSGNPPPPEPEEGPDGEPAMARQLGYSLAFDVLRALVKEKGLDAAQVSRGILDAGVQALVQTSGPEGAARQLYEAADTCATRSLQDRRYKS